VKSKSKNSKPARVNSGSFKAGDLKASNQRGSFKENNLKAYNSRVPRGGARPQEVRSSQTDIPRNWRIVVGDHAIRSALQNSTQWIKQIWVKQGFESSQFLRAIVDEGRKLKISVEVRPEPQIAKVYANHQGALVFVDGRPRLKNAESSMSLKTCILIALDGVKKLYGFWGRGQRVFESTTERACDELVSFPNQMLQRATMFQLRQL
jgi:23S rRNA (guanosine2251-2'-O)-methyltransferase